MTIRDLPFAILLFLFGCTSNGGDDLGADGDADADADVDAGPPPVAIRAVDLLLVVNDSYGMDGPQALLVEPFTTGLVDRLVHPPEGEALLDVHVGVVSSDMGTGGVDVITCDDPADGGDGVFWNVPSDAVTGCEATYPRFLSLEEGGDEDGFEKGVQCVGTLGGLGCGWEQPFAAARAALGRHAADTNAGFLREGSVLVVLFLVDEDDCSVDQSREDWQHVFEADAPDLGSIGFRCIEEVDRLEPVSRFVGDLLALRAESPDRLVVATIAGVPLEGCNLDDVSASDLDCLLAHPDMRSEIRTDPDGTGPTIACRLGTLAAPASPRMVQLVRDVHAVTGNGVVGSICGLGYASAATEIARQVHAALSRGPVP